MKDNDKSKRKSIIDFTPPLVVEILEGLLPWSLVELVLNYYVTNLNLLIDNQKAFSHLGSFLGKEELFSFFFINKTILSVLPLLIGQHYKYAYTTSDERTLLNGNTLTQTLLLQKKFETSPKDRVNELLAEGLEPWLMNGITSNNRNKEFLDLLLLLKGSLISFNMMIMDKPLIVHAVEYGRTKLFKYLLENKAEIHSLKGLEDEKDLINFAFKNDQFEIIRLLEAQFGFSSIPMMKQSKKSHTLLMLAVNSGDIEYVKMILKTRQEEIKGCFHPLAIALKNQDLELLHLLFEHGAKIESMFEEDEEGNSLLNLFIGYFPFQVINSEIGKMPTRNINRIKQIFDLLLSRGEKVNKLKPYILRKLFKNDDYALIKEIISLGYGHSEISMFDIIIKLNDILQNSKNTNDRGLLKFWLNILKEKLPTAANGLFIIFGLSPHQEIQNIGPSADSLESLRHKFFEKASKISLEFKEIDEWHEIETRIKELSAIGKNLIVCYELNRKYSLSRRRSSSEFFPQSLSLGASDSQSVSQSSSEFNFFSSSGITSSACTSSSQSNSTSYSASENMWRLD